MDRGDTKKIILKVKEFKVKCCNVSLICHLEYGVRTQAKAEITALVSKDTVTT